MNILSVSVEEANIRLGGTTYTLDSNGGFTETHNDGVSVDLFKISVLIDGVAIGTPDIISWATIMKKPTKSEVELSTCSCGISGCAGVFSGSLVEFSDSSITITVIDDNIPHTGPFVFDRKAFAETIDELKANIVKYSAINNERLAVVDGDFRAYDTDVVIPLFTHEWLVKYCT